MVKRKKITLQYRCRRCLVRYFEPKLDFLVDIRQIQSSPSLMITIHDCNDNEDKSRFGVADLIGCKVE